MHHEDMTAALWFGIGGFVLGLISLFLVCASIVIQSHREDNDIELWGKQVRFNEHATEALKALFDESKN